MSQISDFTELTRRMPVLIYDYTVTNLPLLQLMLARDGFYAAGIGHAQDALRLCQMYPVSLLVAEFSGSGMDGLELMNLLHQDARMGHLPVIIISARSDTASISTARDAGALDYLVKPFLHTQFQAKVRACLEGHLSDLPAPEQFQAWDEFIGHHLPLDEKGLCAKLPRDEGWLGPYYPPPVPK